MIYLTGLEKMYKEKYLQGHAKGIFLDYCHLTETGHKLVAQWLLPVIDEVVTTSKLDIPFLSNVIREDPRAQTKSDFRGHELYAQALTFENNGRLDLEEKTYLEALQYLPDFNQIYANLGHLYAGQNDLEKAKTMYEKALLINPNNHLVLLSIGYIKLQGGGFDHAEKLFKKALNITTDIPNAYSGLGYVAMQRNNFQQAVQYYNESLKLGQDSVWLRENLAHAYLSIGDKENALANWKRVLQYSPFDKKSKILTERGSQEK